MLGKEQSVLQKRAAAGFILRLTGAWRRKPTNKQKHLLGPRCPACGFLLSMKIAANAVLFEYGKDNSCYVVVKGFLALVQSQKLTGIKERAGGQPANEIF